MDLIQLSTWMTRITHLVMDDLVPSDFRPTTHLMSYWGIFSFWLRFLDLHWFAWSYPFTIYMSSWWSAFILWWFPSGAFLKWFSQTHTFWYCHDSVMELSQAQRLPYHHFRGVHIKSPIHPHWVILESSGRTRCTSCYTRVHFPRLPTWGDALVAILEHISHFMLWRRSSSHRVVTIFFIQLMNTYSHYWS